ncbi:MAG: hypothetical protein ACQETI_13545 [Halobacteriota archaeon]
MTHNSGPPTSAVALLAVLLVAAATAGVTSAAGDTEVFLSPTDASIDSGDTTTFDVVVNDADGGVGAVTVTVALDADIGTIVDVGLRGDPGFRDVQTADDGSSTTVNAAAMDTDDTGNVSVASVTVRGGGVGASDVSLAVEALGDEGGHSYSVTETRGASLTVSDTDDDTGDTGDDTDDTDDTDDADDTDDTDDTDDAAGEPATSDSPSSTTEANSVTTDAVTAEQSAADDSTTAHSDDSERSDAGATEETPSTDGSGDGLLTPSDPLQWATGNSPVVVLVAALILSVGLLAYRR